MIKDGVDEKILGQHEEELKIAASGGALLILNMMKQLVAEAHCRDCMTIHLTKLEEGIKAGSVIVMRHGIEGIEEDGK